MQEQQQLPGLPRLRCAAKPSPASASLLRGSPSALQLLQMRAEAGILSQGISAAHPLHARRQASSSDGGSDGGSPQQAAELLPPLLSQQQLQQDRSELLLQEVCPSQVTTAAGSSIVWPQPAVAVPVPRARSNARLASSSGGGGLQHSQTLEALDLLEHLVDSSPGAAGQRRQQHLMQLQQQAARALVDRGEAAAAAAAVGSGASFSYEALLQLQDVLVVTPQQVLQALPRVHWSQQAATEAAATGSSSSCEGQRCTICAICQCDFEAGDLLLELTCRHQFHEPCVQRWLGGYSKKCPVCKSAVCD